jgi:branched-chain amino acid transport system substrate-binding protein
MREAAKDNPDLLVSLYSDAGYIGAMRGRAALGITIPVITTGICSSADVLDVVGDDAIGWTFVGAATRKESPELHILQDVMAPALGVTPDEVDVATLGLGGLALNQMMSLAEYADMMQAEGTEITGASIYEYLRTSIGLLMWPKGAEMACGSAEKYPSVCSFTFPVAESLAGGVVETIDGLEAVSAKELLP